MSSSDEASVLSEEAARRRTTPVRSRGRKTQAERSDETQARVLVAAATVLRRKGYAGLRTEDVARVAKVSRGAMQHQFPTKDSLILATARSLLRDGLERGRARAERARREKGDVIDAIIEDAVEFFLGPDFSTILDLVLAGSKDRALKDEIYAYTRASRLGVEAAWLDLLESEGLPRAKAEKVLWLTLNTVRGLSVRALWQRDEALFEGLIDEWKQILTAHLKQWKGDST